MLFELHRKQNQRKEGRNMGTMIATKLKDELRSLEYASALIVKMIYARYKIMMGIII